MFKKLLAFTGSILDNIFLTTILVNAIALTNNFFYNKFIDTKPFVLYLYETFPRYIANFIFNLFYHFNGLTEGLDHHYGYVINKDITKASIVFGLSIIPTLFVIYFIQKRTQKIPDITGRRILNIIATLIAIYFFSFMWIIAYSSVFGLSL